MTKQKRCLLIGALFLTVVGCQRRPLWDGSGGESCEVHFSAGSLKLEAETKAPDDKVALEVGSTVRVVAYQRSSAGQTEPNLETDIWKATATYKVQSDGTTLVACEVDDTGAETGTSVKGMELNNGTYDFYAYSTARKLEADNRTVKGVGHGEDFLGAYVGSRAINRSSSSVALDFEHECTKITFSVVPAEGMSCNDLSVSKVGMKRLATAPAADYTIGGDLAATVGDETSTGEIVGFDYIDPLEKGKGASGSGIFLPKSNGVVPAEFTIRVNELDYVLTAELPSIAFLKGNDYRFTARVKQGSVDLVLDVLSWGAVDQNLDGFGGPNGSIEVGSWGNIDWNGSIGGNPDVNQAPIEVGTWTAVVQSLDFLGSNSGGNVSGWDEVDSGSEGIGR